MAPEHLLATFAKVCAEILASASDGTLKIEDAAGLSVLQTYISVSAEPATFVQGALPHILKKITNGFFSNTIEILKEAADIFYTKPEEIPCLTCPQKPDGAMSCMVKLNMSLLEDIHDDMDFCLKLAREETVVVLLGAAVGIKNWLRVTFAVDPEALEDGLNNPNCITIMLQENSVQSLNDRFY